MLLVLFVTGLVAFLVYRKFFAAAPITARKTPTRNIRITELNIYPIKSCKRVSLQSVEVKPAGFQWDRQWMIVKESDNRFITQRQVPKLATIAPTIGVKHLEITAPGQSTLRVPLQFQERPVITVTCWDDTVPAYDEGDEAAAWLSAYLETPVRLVREKVPRVIPKSAVPTAHNITDFTDGFPFLFVNEKSVSDINTKLPSPITSTRFRPSIIFSGDVTPWEEDSWRHVNISGIDFHFAKNCDRCKQTTVDQEKGVFSGEDPLATLRKHRQSALKPEDALFGVYMIHTTYQGTLRVGDFIEVLTTGEPHPIAPPK